MEVRYDLTPGTRAEVIENPDGTIIGFKLTPFFATRRSSAVMAHGSSVNAQNNPLQEFLLIASGVTGSVIQRKRSKSVKPYIDLTPEEVAAASEEADEEDDEGTK